MVYSILALAIKLSRWSNLVRAARTTFVSLAIRGAKAMIFNDLRYNNQKYFRLGMYQNKCLFLQKSRKWLVYMNLE